MVAWNVYNRFGDKIDTVWYSRIMSSEEVRLSLIKHDGHDSDITVVAGF